MFILTEKNQAAAVRQAQAPENRTGTSRHKLYV